MMKQYELEQIIKDALLDLDGHVEDAKLGDGSVCLFGVDVEKDSKTGDLLLTFKETLFREASDDDDIDLYEDTTTTDVYRIKIELVK